MDYSSNFHPQPAIVILAPIWSVIATQLTGPGDGVKLFSDNDTARDRDVPNFTIGPWHFKEQGRSRLFSSYICYARQTLHEGNSCTTGLCLGKALSHRRCITKHSRTGTRHNSDSKGNVSHRFPTCGPRQLRALTLEKELCQLCQQQGWRVGRCSVQREHHRVYFRWRRNARRSVTAAGI